jgi:hypothetical protein
VPLSFQHEGVRLLGDRTPSPRSGEPHAVNEKQPKTLEDEWVRFALRQDIFRNFNIETAAAIRSGFLCGGICSLAQVLAGAVGRGEQITVVELLEFMQSTIAEISKEFTQENGT